MFNPQARSVLPVRSEASVPASVPHHLIVVEYVEPSLFGAPSPGRYQTSGTRRITVLKIDVFMMAVAIAATTVLSALQTPSERLMRTRVVRKVSDAPTASSKGA